ncbi:hypothetical protein HN51_048412 [Arachis hypogaea]
MIPATQFLSRGIPFIFNTWIVTCKASYTRGLCGKSISIAVYIFSLYAVQFHLFVTCVLFLSREGFRQACVRMEMQSDCNTKDVVKLMKVVWMSFPLGIFITIVACSFVLWLQGLSYSSSLGQAVLINGLACILELLAEPLYILSQNLVLLELRLMVETVATISRCLTMYFLLVKKSQMVRAYLYCATDLSNFLIISINSQCLTMCLHPV